MTVNFNTILEIATSLIVSFGGAGAIIFSFSSFFGKQWANQSLEKIRAQYAEEIASHKNQLDLMKEASLRYSNHQFELYNSLWVSLYDLKIKADILWEKADRRNLNDFVEQLSLTKYQVEKNALFLEDAHYEELSKLLRSFSEYELGKTKLIDYRMQRRTAQSDSIDFSISEMIETNKVTKHNYDDVVKRIKIDFKNQIRGISS